MTFIINGGIINLQKFTIYSGVKKVFLLDLIKKLWSRGKTVSRIDFNNYYRKFGYPTPFIERHKSAPGVNEVYKKLKVAHDNFREQRAKIAEEEKSKENKLFTTWKVIHLIKTISKRLFLIGLIVSIVLFFLYAFNENLSTDFSNTVMVLMFLITPIPFISKVLEIITRFSYGKYSDRIKNKLIALKSEYLDIEMEYENEMDTLCLNSLSEEAREAEEHHREMIALQEKNAQALSAELKKIKKENRNNINSLKKDVGQIKDTLGIDD